MNTKTELLPHTTDARIWADEFVSTYKRAPHIASDHGTMISWFSNSIAAGWDEHQRRFRRKSRLERLRYAWHNWSW